VVTATSQANSGGQHVFTITKTAAGITRGCGPAGAQGKGGCKADGTW
jgi:hypothetical protein